MLCTACKESFEANKFNAHMCVTARIAANERLRSVFEEAEANPHQKLADVRRKMREALEEK